MDTDMSLKLPQIRMPPKIGGIKKSKKMQPPARIKDTPYTADMSDRERRAYYNTCGTPEERNEIVMRFRSLMQEFPSITYPEAITYYLLEKRRLKFYFQSSFDGGRTEFGGLVADFIVDIGGIAIALQVQGNYWHNKPEIRERDILYNERIVGDQYAGLVITTVIEVWESKLMSCDRDDTIERALQGEGVGE